MCIVPQIQPRKNLQINPRPRLVHLQAACLVSHAWSLCRWWIGFGREPLYWDSWPSCFGTSAQKHGFKPSSFLLEPVPWWDILLQLHFWISRWVVLSTLTWYFQLCLVYRRSGFSNGAAGLASCQSMHGSLINYC